jgi:pimeloyl-ACP methyl ester carboxylesterase
MPVTEQQRPHATVASRPFSQAGPPRLRCGQPAAGISPTGPAARGSPGHTSPDHPGLSHRRRHGDPRADQRRRRRVRAHSVSCFADSAQREAFWQGLPVPTTRRDEQRYLAKTVALARRCGERNGDLLTHISTADTARDLDYLRGLVGDSRLTFLGESTGTLLGQTYANMFPRRVRAMALDGLEDPVSYTADVATALASTLADADRVFDEFLALCERPALPAVRWPATVRCSSGSTECSGGCGSTLSQPRLLRHRANSPTARHSPC